jgi:hypothetical protein
MVIEMSIPWRPVLASLVGGTAGMTYYLLVGCDSG